MNSAMAKSSRQIGCVLRLSLLAFLCLAPMAHAAILRVNAAATGANNGTSWTDAFIDLQSALAAAQEGDEIWVGSGTYMPTGGTDRSASFVMKASVAMYGGFAGAETLREQRDWTAHETILSGDIGAVGEIGSEADAEDNSFHVVVGAADAVLDGFTITGGNSEYENGGGMINVSVSPVVSNCLFIKNVVFADTSLRSNGGGMYNLNASPVIDRCAFKYNRSLFGGGIANADSSPTVTNCLFDGNWSPQGGGGIYNERGAASIHDCSIVGNYGGGIYNSGAGTVSRCQIIGNTADAGGGINEGGSAVIEDCVMWGNSAKLGGGMNIAGTPVVLNCILDDNFAGDNVVIGRGGAISNSGSPSIRNCILTRNFSEADGGAIFNSGGAPEFINCTIVDNGSYQGPAGGLYNAGGSPYFVNCIFWDDLHWTDHWAVLWAGGNPVFRSCDLQWSGGSGPGWDSEHTGFDAGGNIDADPLFIDEDRAPGPDEIWATEDDGLRLKANSPCTDSGINIHAPANDLLGLSRAGRPDIGAYESFYLNAARDWALYE